jgi:hypothetical protein
MGIRPYRCFWWNWAESLMVLWEFPGNIKTSLYLTFDQWGVSGSAVSWVSKVSLIIMT